MEASLKPLQKPRSEPRRNTFEGVDLVAAGRKGGQASGISRKLRKQRAIEEAIFERSKNGYALIRLHEIEARRNRELEREQIRMDRLVNQLMDEADEERALLERSREERRELLERIGALSHREQALEASIAAEEPELVDRLRQLHEAGGLVPALVALDLFDAVDDEPLEVSP